ncbi:hypothetical protein SAMN05216462_2919 [Xylanibacter ruminicola]|uniref:Glycosyl transferase family 2 n=1 Tax=Xylanibacter ruminicola TaxID=839 RepID=A0A1H4ES69_XYLRU|nr:hypothetical protein [Xylanibacter ruminicola]SEA87729.1 hypothetical protein SAMN05216462_2919 [Xylanibacter ruminicola]
MDKQPILSLCIPTNGAVDWILPVIESIYSQGYDNEKFEVVITDNGKDSQLPAHIARMDYSNLRYKQTTDEGFLNLVSCLKEGKGLFCKMINHRSVMLPGSIADMVELVEKYQDTQPVIYCADGALPERDEVIECSNTDAFIMHLSYFCSWSAGIGFWQKDIKRIDTIELNNMFPNTSLLLEIRQESEYVIWNKKYEKMEDDAGKGGYNLFHTFAVILPGILSDLLRRNRISQSTFNKFKKDLFRFLCSLYTNEVIKPTKHTFIIRDVRQNVSHYYGNIGYWRFIITAYVWAVYAGFSKLKRIASLS